MENVSSPSLDFIKREIIRLFWLSDLIYDPASIEGGFAF